jgi:hypothetical protein
VCIAQNGPGITNFVTGLRCRAHPRARAPTNTRTHGAERRRRRGVLGALTRTPSGAHSAERTPRGTYGTKRTPRCTHGTKCTLGVLTVLSAGVAAAYWAHSPVVCITPEAGSATKGYGGFQVQ